jgi:DNA-binding NtrC family response regulator
MTSRYIAKSLVLQEKLELAGRFISTNMPILILGEAGTGKSRFAREAHTTHMRGAPFVVLNCAFGFRGGTAAEVLAHKTARAQGGTLLIDEAGLLDENAQQALLGILAGENTGVRVIATSRHDIEQRAHDGSYSKELAAALGLLPIYLPPLRQMPEQIAALAAYFLRRAAVCCKKRLKGFTPAARTELRAIRWVGNVRELKNCVELACQRAGDETDRIDYCHLRPGEASAAGSITGAPQVPLKEAIDTFKAAYIKETLAAHDGNRSAAARTLKIQRTYLSALIKTYNID